MSAKLALAAWMAANGLTDDDLMTPRSWAAYYTTYAATIRREDGNRDVLRHCLDRAHTLRHSRGWRHLA